MSLAWCPETKWPSRLCNVGKCYYETKSMRLMTAMNILFLINWLSQQAGIKLSILFFQEWPIESGQAGCYSHWHHIADWSPPYIQRTHYVPWALCHKLIEVFCYSLPGWWTLYHWKLSRKCSFFSQILPENVAEANQVHGASVIITFGSQCQVTTEFMLYFLSRYKTWIL